MYLNVCMTEPRVNPAIFQGQPPKDSARKDFNSHIKAIALHKDRQAFAQLFAYFAPRVKSFLLKGGVPEEQADELAQETMLAVWQRAPSFDSAQASLSTWIFTIARNKRIDMFRKSGRIQFGHDDTLTPDTDALDPIDRLQLAQEETDIAQAIKNLPAEQAELIQKAFFEDKSHADIAKETNIPLGTVKSRIRLGLERLRHVDSVRQLWDV